MGTAHNFSFGLLNPVLGYAMSCLGSFLGLRCVGLARCYTGRARFRWLGLAAVSIGATGIWATHFIAMLGFALPGQVIYYSVPLTVGSILIAVAVAGVGLYIAGPGPSAFASAAFNRAAFNGATFDRAGFPRPRFSSAGFLRDGGQRLLAGGVIIGGGVAVVHYMGMAAMSMRGTMSYNMPLVVLSVLIAVVASTVALWIGTWIRGRTATVGAALIMGVAVTGMHYAGMAAVDVHAMAMPSMAAAESGAAVVSGAAAATFLIPLLLVISLATFVLTLTISLAPSEREISADAEMARQLRYLEQRRR